MRTAEEVLKPFETYVKHSGVPIYLQESVIEAMKQYASEALDRLDVFLAMQEDVAHGQEGKTITAIRAELHGIQSELK